MCPTARSSSHLVVLVRLARYMPRHARQSTAEGSRADKASSVETIGLARLKGGAFWKGQRLRPVFATRAVPVAKVLAAPAMEDFDQGSRVLKVDAPVERCANTR